jgi:hypothetical protein
MINALEGLTTHPLWALAFLGKASLQLSLRTPAAIYRALGLARIREALASATCEIPAT